MDIVCSTDNNYVMPLGVMLCSLFENNREERIQVHILCGSVSLDNKHKLLRVVKKYNQQICFYDMNDKDFSDFPVGEEYQVSSITLAAYYRLFLTKILPENIAKVLYLDCDMIVCDSLKSLWDIDISNYAIGGVLDPESNMPYAYNRLRYAQSEEYFNSGMLLINLDYWRSHEALKRFYEIAADKSLQLNYHDQDILNLCFHREKKIIDFKYNVQTDFLYKHEYLRLTWEYWDELDASIRKIYIIHYIYQEKPWFKDCEHPYKSEFEKYKALTEWKNVSERYYRSKKIRLKKMVKKILISLGLVNSTPNKYREDLKIYNEYS